MFIRFRYWCRHDFFFLLAHFTTAAIVLASNFREQGQFSQLGGSMARCGLALLVFRSLVLAGVLGLVLNFATALHAADKATEQRDFTIYVDGSQAGAYSMAITEHEDGSQSMAASANVRVSYLAGLRSYRYSYQGTETWKAGRHGQRIGRAIAFRGHSANECGRQSSKLHALSINRRGPSGSLVRRPRALDPLEIRVGRPSLRVSADPCGKITFSLIWPWGLPHEEGGRFDLAKNA